MPKIISKASGKVYNIDLPLTYGAEEFPMICPICTPGRQPAHKNEKKLSINLNKTPMMWRCNHCNESGAVITKEYLEQAKFKPIIKEYNFLEPSEKLIKWFWEKRRISAPTLKHFDVTISEESILQHNVPESEIDFKGKWVVRKCINFKYFKNNVLINVKFRDEYKNFKLVKDATKTMFNIDAIKDSKEAWIVEGEPDVLALFEAGIAPVTSVPNGTTISEKEKKHFEETGKLVVMSALNMSYLDDVIHEFDDKEVIYLATDADAGGIKLREELARRLGKDKCEYIVWSDFYKQNEQDKCKDANDVLIHKGPDFLKKIHEYAHKYPVEGISTASNYKEELIDVFDNGYSKGLSTGYKTLDPHFLWVPGWTYFLNGYPGEGKSSLFFNMMVISSVLYNWKWGLFCPENYPASSIVTTLAEILVGNTADVKFNSRENPRMSKEQFLSVIENHIDKHFFFVEEKKDGFTPEELRAKKLELIKKHGINGFFTDPWKNLVKKSADFNDWLNSNLASEVRLATSYSLINVIAHHPPTPPRDKDKDYPAPGTMDLIGGMIWYSSAYGMFCVHRHSRDDQIKNTLAEFHIQKQKIQKIAGVPTNRNNPVLLKYERRTNRFLESPDFAEENANDWTFPIDNYFESKQTQLEGF